MATAGSGARRRVRRGGRRLSRALPSVGVAAGMLLAGALAGLPPAFADAETCPNRQIRAAQGSTTLPDCRAYELVSPVYKGGYSITGIVAVAPEGEKVAFGSLGAFAGVPANVPSKEFYVAQRGQGGWSTVPVTPPATLVPYGEVADFSPTLTSTLGKGFFGSSAAAAAYEGTEGAFLLQDLQAPDTPAGFQAAGTVLKARDGGPFGISYQGASPDFSHLAFVVGNQAEGNAHTQLLPEAASSSAAQLYDLDVGEGGPSTLRLVGLDNGRKLIDPSCEVRLGSSEHKQSDFDALAADGEEVFFSLGCAPSRVFVRVAGSTTVEVSRPLAEACPRGEVPCPGAGDRDPAEFQGASRDGSKAFFTAALGAAQPPLVPGDGDRSVNLYMAEIGCPSGTGEECERAGEAAGTQVSSLVEVSRDPSGRPAEVQGVVATAPDGSRVYFVARGVLSEGPNAEGRVPLRGADNLYVYDSVSGGAPAFVGELCSGPGESGAVEDVRCPADETVGEHGSNDTPLWLFARPEAQVNQCAPSLGECAGAREPGRFLVFSTYAQLLPGDTDEAKDVYRYDAATGTLARVSVGEGGYGANGNGSGCEGARCDAKIPSSFEPPATVVGGFGLGDRAVGEDGARIVFGTAEALSPAAVNGLENVYEWHEQPGGEGAVTLISTGAAGEAVEKFAISGTGDDVFFTTTQGLVAQDTDGQNDLYDARVGGGFAVAPAAARPCSGDACQGPLTNPAPLLVPGSVAQPPGENLPAPAPAVAKTKAKGKVKKGSSKGRRSRKRTKSKRKAKMSSARSRR